MIDNNLYKRICILLGFLFFVATAQAQDDVINNSKMALKTGSSKELVAYFHDRVELGIDGDKSQYSKTQAEFVLKGFFKKNPPTDFQIVHQGSSEQGLRYVIGKYSYSGGSYRVYMLIKQFNGSYLIDTLDFSKE